MKVTTLLGGSSFLASTVLLAQAFADPQGEPMKVVEAAGNAGAVQPAAENPAASKPAKPMMFSRMYLNENGETVSVEFTRDPKTGTITRKDIITGKDGKTIERGSTTVKEGNVANTTGYIVGPDGKILTTQATTTKDGGVRTTKEVTTRPNGETVTRQVSAHKEDGKVIEQVEGQSSNGKAWTNTITRPQMKHDVMKSQAANHPAEVHVMKAPGKATAARGKAQVAPRKDESPRK